MNPKSDITNIANQDWSKFDFTRWNLEGLKLDSQPAALAGWVREVTLSSQAPQTFAAGLGAVKSAALQDLQGQVKTLQTNMAAADAELTTRLTATQQQISALKESMRVAGVPAVIGADPDCFHLSSKVIDHSTQLGMPSLKVRLYDTGSPKASLAAATTDQNGNAVLTLDREQTEALVHSKSEIAVEVLTANGKSVFNGPAPCPKLNQTATFVAPLASSADLAPHLQAANAVTAQQQAMLGALSAKIDALNAHYQQMKADSQQQLQEVQGLIAQLQTS